MTDLFWNHQCLRPLGQTPSRSIYTARDGEGRLYTIGLDIGGTNGFAAVYDPETLETLHANTCFGYRIHADELKRHLQDVAKSLPG
jgi:hypothetical protein